MSTTQPPRTSPEGRYGRPPSSRRRRTTLVLAAVVAVAGIAWVVWAGVHQGRADVRWSAVGYQVLDDGLVEVTYDVGKDPAATAVCSLRALDRHKTAVGVAEVEVGPTAERVTRRTDQVRTSALAVTGIVTECRVA